MKNKKKGFTLVELLAVIVILAIILVIAVPKIMETIQKTKVGSMESSAKLTAKAVENKYQSSMALGEVETIPLTGNCMEYGNLDTNEYESCTYEIVNGKAKVTLTATDNGKFSGLVCEDATKVSATCTSEVICTGGEEIEYASVENVTTCKNNLKETIAIKFYGGTYSSLDTNKQTNASNDANLICNASGDTLKSYIMAFINYGMNTSDFEDAINVKFLCPKTNTLSKKYIDKMNLTKTDIKSISFKKKSNFDSTGLTGIDVSQKGDESVIGYYNTTTNALTFVSDNIIYLPKDSTYLFNDMESVKSYTFENVSTSRVTIMFAMFNDNYALESLDLSNFDTSNVTDMRGMFSDCESLKTLDLSKFNTSKVTDMSSMFSGCEALETLNVNKFNTSQVTSMSNMFNNCESLKSISISNFNTSNVTEMGYMFSNCKSLETLDLSSFDTSKVTTMLSMFSHCDSLETLNLNSFNTSQVTIMECMFQYCKSLKTLNVSSFNTINVEDMSFMFNNCESLETLDLSSFNTSKVTNMLSMFNSCISLEELNLSSFDTSKVTNMNSMFYKDSKIITELRISNNVTNYYIALLSAATESGSSITLKGTSDYETIIDNIISTKSNNSNVIKNIS